MVTQNTWHSCERKHGFLKIVFKFAHVVDLNKYPEQITFFRFNSTRAYLFLSYHLTQYVQEVVAHFRKTSLIGSKRYRYNLKVRILILK